MVSYARCLPPKGRNYRRVAIALLIALTLALPALAQRGRFGRRGFGPLPSNVAYDGRMTIVRLWYSSYPGWSYDYPDMEQNLTLILKDISLLPVRQDGSNILKMDDPELLKYPISWLSEPGYWYPSDREVLGLRTYIEKGGFVIIDDFHFPEEWSVFEDAMRRVLPKGRIVRLDKTHPVFNSFFSIKSLDVPYPGRLGEQGLMAEFYGIHEDNDPSKRLLVVINYNVDIGDYMEHSGRGFYSVDPTNEAFKFGVNYFTYGLTH
jgi:Domain of unknown function (DUF4159)